MYLASLIALLARLTNLSRGMNARSHLPMLQQEKSVPINVFCISAVMEDIVTWKSPVLSDLYKKFRLFITSFEAVVKILHCDKIDFEKMCE